MFDELFFDPVFFDTGNIPPPLVPRSSSGGSAWIVRKPKRNIPEDISIVLLAISLMEDEYD